MSKNWVPGLLNLLVDNPRIPSLYGTEKRTIRLGVGPMPAVKRILPDCRVLGVRQR